MQDKTKKPGDIAVEMISPVELTLLKIVRSLLPFQKVEIMADKMGKPGVFIVTRTDKIIVGEGPEPMHLKA